MLRNERLTIWIGVSLLVVASALSAEVASAKEIRFIAQEMAKERAIWQPGTIVIDQKTDLKEPLYFVLENPTGTDHEFAVGGLLMVLPEETTSSLRPDPFTGPITGHVMAPTRVQVKANSAVKIQVAPIGLEGARNLGARYPFFCPTHKDLHLGGFILVE
ncbi:MAG: hypothetical protein AB1555_15510 [Nitrospirota bacterium]